MLKACLNAPSGAQCFPTGWLPSSREGMKASQCTFWCSVLSDGRTATEIAEVTGVQSQCTFWCSVLSDRSRPIRKRGQSEVSMHLLVLSAFRQAQQIWDEIEDSCLNAPSGAQCFPTELTLFYPTDVKGLNAPSGAQCFPTGTAETHILLYDTSQCTFWCSVLSDSAPRRPRHNAVYRNEIAADLESTTSNRLAPVQLNHTTAKNRHKPPQRRRRPLPASTPPASNEPKPKNRPLTTTPELTSSYWASRILCCKVMPILPAE